jgi:hypothetical protein
MLAAVVVNLRGFSKVRRVIIAASSNVYSDTLQVSVPDQVHQEPRIR